MKLYSYVVARDYRVRSEPVLTVLHARDVQAQIRAQCHYRRLGRGHRREDPLRAEGRLIYAMQVAKSSTSTRTGMTPRFLCKRTVLNGSLSSYTATTSTIASVAAGFRRIRTTASKMEGQITKNIAHDTSVNRLLVATKFVYWGRAAPRSRRRSDRSVQRARTSAVRARPSVNSRPSPCV